MFCVKAVHGFLILLLGSSLLFGSSKDDLYIELLQSGAESSLYVGACDHLIDETLKYFNAPNSKLSHVTIKSACKLYLANELLKCTKKIFNKLPKEVRLSYRESSKRSDNRKHFYNEYIKEALLDRMMSEATSKSNLKEYERIRASMFDLAGRYRLPIYDTNDLFNLDEALFVDNVHLSDRGSARAAEVINDKI